MNCKRTVATFAILLVCTACSRKIDIPRAVGDPAQGRIALTQYACHACHIIPGVTGSTVFVGPSLAGLASRPLIVGNLPNNTENLITWIRHPQHIDPHTAMPDMGVTEKHAHDIAAYLAMLK